MDERYWAIFEQNVTDLAVFYARTRAWPNSRATEPAERRLSTFIREQRTRANGGKGADLFTDSHRRLLETKCPSWDQPSEDKFRARARALGAFRDQHGRWPVADSSDHDERRAALVRTESRARERGTLLPPLGEARRAIMDAEAAGWNDLIDSDQIETHWRSQIAEIVEWFQVHDAFPSVSRDPAEARLGRILANARAAYRGSARGQKLRWSPERTEHLNTVLPGWDQTQVGRPKTKRPRS